MKRFLALLLMLVLLFPLSVGSIQSPTGFAGKLWAGTLALYGTKNRQTHFLCTAEPIGNISGGYLLLSAGHCVQETPADLKFSVAEEIGGKRYPVQMVKAYDGDGFDFSIFNFQTPNRYPIFELGDEHDAHVGDATISPNFGLGLGKQLSLGVISSLPIQKSEGCDDEGCIGKFLVQESAGAGASGSAVLSVKTHKVIGLLVYEFREGNVGFAVEPISMFAKFMAGPGQPHPSSDEAAETPTVLIPSDVFAAQFSSAHPFTLTTRGPNPTFTQGGYKFTVNTDGFELSDDYYYNVPVFINASADGYRLESTKDGVSVDVTVLGKA